MKRILMSVTLLVAVVIMTGCDEKKTLTCTKDNSDGGFVNNIETVYEFTNDKIEKATQTNLVELKDDYVQYFEDYEKNAKAKEEEYKDKKGFETKVESGDNKISLTITMDPSKMGDEDLEEYNLGENYDSLKYVLETNGYTCK